jgi:hypothetical protein
MNAKKTTFDSHIVMLKNKYHKSLNTIHHNRLWSSLGTCKRSPVESVYVAAGEPSLETQVPNLFWNIHRIHLRLCYFPLMWKY